MIEKTSLTNKTNSKNIDLQNNPIKIKLSKNEIDLTNNSLTLKSIDDSIVEEKAPIDLNNNSYKEEQLSILYDVFLTTYSKKSYNDLIKEIEEKVDLLFPFSKMSFEIEIIKIKCLMKLLLEEYNDFLKTRNKTFHEMDTIINKINYEFKVINKIMINNDSYEYEIITQNYCKFLYLLSKISLKKEDYNKSLGFVSLGINMLKIFFMKKILASDINTYKIYCKLLLEIINILIGDKNYEQALIYSSTLLKVIEISLKYIYYNNKNNTKKKINNQKSKKFINFSGCAYLYIGCCLEQFDNNVQALEAYREALFFLNKSSRLGISFQNLNSVTINNSCSYIAMDTFEKLKLKFENDKIELLNRQKKLELLRKKEEYELMQKEKLIKLKYIANGITGDPFKFEKLLNKLNKKIFPSSVVNDLEKMDDDITSLVSTYFNKNKKDSISTYKDKMSYDTKNFMSRYEIYNILMSKKFRNFIQRTKKLQFYNPKTGSKSVSIIQRHLNNKIQIELQSKKKINVNKKLYKIKDNNNNNLESSNTNHIYMSTENIKTTTTSPNSNRDDEKHIEKILFNKINKKNRNKNNNLKIFLSLANTNAEKTPNKKLNPPIKLNTTRSMTNTNIKTKHKNFNFRDLECDFERKNIDKNLMTKNYLRKYFYYDKLSNKELKFQKLILKFRSNNTLYNEKKTVEEKNGVIGKDDLAIMSLIINEKANAKPRMDEKKIEMKLLKDSFTYKKQNQVSLQMKSAMSKVINKYIKERKERLSAQGMIDSERIRRINEKNILELGNSIKDINNNYNNLKLLVSKKK